MNKKLILIGLGAVAVIGVYAFFYMRKNNITDFSSQDAEYQELLRQYLVLQGLPNTMANRIKYSNMTKEQLESALGY